MIYYSNVIVTETLGALNGKKKGGKVGRCHVGSFGSFGSLGKLKGNFGGNGIVGKLGNGIVGSFGNVYIKEKEKLKPKGGNLNIPPNGGKVGKCHVGRFGSFGNLGKLKGNFGGNGIVGKPGNGIVGSFGNVYVKLNVVVGNFDSIVGSFDNVYVKLNVVVGNFDNFGKSKVGNFGNFGNFGKEKGSFGGKGIVGKFPNGILFTDLNTTLLPNIATVVTTIIVICYPAKLERNLTKADANAVVGLAFTIAAVIGGNGGLVGPVGLAWV